MTSSKKSINPAKITFIHRDTEKEKPEDENSISTVQPDEPVQKKVTPSSVEKPNDNQESTGEYERIIRKFIGDADVVRARNGKVYLKFKDLGNDYHVKVGSTQSNLFLRRQSADQEQTLKDKDIKAINDNITAHAEMDLVPVDIFLRVAPYKDGIEIDLGDAKQTRIRITPGNVESISSGSNTVFCRSAITLPFDPPAKEGDVSLLKKYLKNLRAQLQVLLRGWISYTLAHPKVDTSKFVHLILVGSQGSGKSFLCRLLSKLIDPCTIGLQVMPNRIEDLIVAAQNSHLLLFDNVRKLSQMKSDALCVASTGGAISSRKKYTDDDQHINDLHIPLVLNGIFDFITESDLASRSLVLYLGDMDETKRLSEKELERTLKEDIPIILQGMFQLIADILKVLPEAKVLHPERMIDFCQWLAAMEMVDGAPPGAYQELYSETLKEAQLNTLLENELAAAVYRMADKLESDWNGTPANLLHELNDTASFQAMRSPDWPKSPESLGKRLRILKPALASQGVYLRFSHSGDRGIAITTKRIEEMY